MNWSLPFPISNPLQDWRADVWWDGGAGPGGFWRDDDIGGVPVCPIPHCLCQQHRPLVHHSLHKVWKGLGKERGASTPLLLGGALSILNTPPFLIMGRIWEHPVKFPRSFIWGGQGKGRTILLPSELMNYWANSKFWVPIVSVSDGGVNSSLNFSCRSEEKCLVRSGLVQLMDRLCSLSSQTESSSNEKQTKKQKVATMAWAAFQVLANRCVEWEKEEGRNTGNIFCSVC